VDAAVELDGLLEPRRFWEACTTSRAMPWGSDRLLRPFNIAADLRDNVSYRLLLSDELTIG